MHDLSHSFRAEFAELSIDRNSPANMNGRERRISALLSTDSVFRSTHFIFDLGLSVAWLLHRRQHLQFICWFVQVQREGRTPTVPFPSAEGNEARTSRETFGVIVDDVISIGSRNEP